MVKLESVTSDLVNSLVKFYETFSVASLKKSDRRVNGTRILYWGVTEFLKGYNLLEINIESTPSKSVQEIRIRINYNKTSIFGAEKETIMPAFSLIKRPSEVSSKGIAKTEGAIELVAWNNGIQLPNGIFGRARNFTEYYTSELYIGFLSILKDVVNRNKIKISSEVYKVTNSDGGIFLAVLPKSKYLRDEE